MWSSLRAGNTTAAAVAPENTSPTACSHSRVLRLRRDYALLRSQNPTRTLFVICRYVKPRAVQEKRPACLHTMGVKVGQSSARLEKNSNRLSACVSSLSLVPPPAPLGISLLVKPAHHGIYCCTTVPVRVYLVSVVISTKGRRFRSRFRALCYTTVSGGKL